MDKLVKLIENMQTDLSADYTFRSVTVSALFGLLFFAVFLSKINSGEVGLAFAVATIYMIPGLLVFLYGEEYLVEGITYQGGIKG